MRIDANYDRSRLIRAAMGKLPCDLTIFNVQMVNVITGEIYPSEVDILDGHIVRVREEGAEAPLPAAARYDGEGAYLLPGFIDTHMHVESTMMTPENFGRAAILCGTTTVLVDPHEIANVMGIPGVRYMVENAAFSPVRQLNLAPSCVPSVPGLEQSGADFGPQEVGELLDMPGVVGIAEMMDFIGVREDTPRVHGILDEGLHRGVLIQGHAPKVLDRELAAYILGGPRDDHSSRTAAESIANLRNGLRVNVQSSSLSDSGLGKVVEGIRGCRFTDFVSLCTDDVHAKDLLETGHINRVLKSVIAQGIDPITAIRWATLNGALDCMLEDVGAIAPGYLADLQLVEELDGRNPKAVFVGGKLMCKDGVLTADLPRAPQTAFPNTVHLPEIGEADLRLAAPDPTLSHVRATVVPCMEGGRPKDTPLYEDLPVTEGYVDITKDPALCYVAVFNRHGKGGHTVAVYRDLGLRQGAIAATVGHDSHNLTIAYRDPQDALCAIRYLKREGGGICTVLQGEILAGLPLPIAGLMSDLPCRELVRDLERLEDSVEVVCASRSLMMRITILSLTASPDLRLSDLGLVDGKRQRFVPLFPEV